MDFMALDPVVQLAVILGTVIVILVFFYGLYKIAMND